MVGEMKRGCVAAPLCVVFSVDGAAAQCVIE